jgi:hypothetical protein
MRERRGTARWFRDRRERMEGVSVLDEGDSENRHREENRHEGVRIAREIQVDHDVVSVLSTSLDGPDIPKV